MKERILIALLLYSCSVLAYAEGGTCPPGYYPQNSPGVMGCAPIPNYRGSESDADGEDVAPVWSNRWGAIAVDFSAGKFGAGRATTTRRKAEREALKECKSEGGKNCEIDITYFNQCGVIAWGSIYAATASAGTKEEASARALANCGKHAKECRIYHSDCSLPVRVR